jgi:hypothetical protein
MPEGLFDQPDTHIDHLVIDSPKQEQARFDAQHAIDEETWQRLHEALESSERSSAESLMGAACDFLLIFPEKRAELKLTENFWRTCLDYLKTLENMYHAAEKRESMDNKIRSVEFIVTALSELKTLFPGRDSVEINQAAIDEALIARNSPDEFSTGLKLFMDLKILTGHDQIDLSKPEIVEALKQEVPAVRQYVIDHSHEHGWVWGHFARRVAMARVCLGDRFNSNDITEDDWYNMKEELKVRKSNPDEEIELLTNLVANMKILAADRVVVTEGGLELIMPKVQFEESLPELPEQRGF